MAYFDPPLFDLLKLGQLLKRSVSRKAFARHVVDTAAHLAIHYTGPQDFRLARSVLRDQISHLTWRDYVWVVPTTTYRLDHTIYPVEGYENVLPDSLLGTALKYRSSLNSSAPDERSYVRVMVRIGLEWACHKGQFEGSPNPHGDMPELDCHELNERFAPNPGADRTAA